MKRFLSIILVALMVASVNAATLRVSASGDNSDGSTWAKAYQTIQAALAVAVTGDEVWVQQGVYVIDSDVNQLNYVGGVNVYGGFIGTETTLASRSVDPALTVVSGDENSVDYYRLLTGLQVRTINEKTCLKAAYWEEWEEKVA